MNRDPLKFEVRVCKQCAFWENLEKPEQGQTCAHFGVSGEKMACSDWFPSNPPDMVNYASSFLTILVENARSAKHAIESSQQLDMINFHSSSMQADFHGQEFIELVAKLSGLASIKSLCSVFGLPESIMLSILENYVRKFFR